MRARLIFCAGSLVSLSLAFACSTFDNNPSSSPPQEENDGGGADAIVGASEETFSIGEVKDKVHVVQGKSTKLTLSITRTPALQQKALPIELTLLDPPAGVTLTPVKVSPQLATVEIELVAASNAKQGDVKVRVEGNVQGTNVRASRELAVLVRGPTGSVDTTFAVDGFQKAVFGNGPNAFFQRAFVMSDGRTIIAAETTNASGYALARLDANGMLDPTYGDQGRFYLDEYNTASAVMAPDGTVYAIGNHPEPFETRFCRVTSTGKRDTALNQTGCVAVDFGGAMALTPDGNILVAGSDLNGGIQFMKLTTSGAIVTSFGTQGKTTVKHGTATDALHGLIVRPDGRVLATDRISQMAGVAFQLTAAGIVDPSFTVPQMTPVQYDGQFDLFLQTDGRFVVSMVRGDRTMLAGFKEDGTRDLTFVGTGFPGVEGKILLGSLARTPSGHIAFSTCTTGASRFYRVDTKGIPDPTVGDPGLALAIEPEPDAGVDSLRPCGPLIPVADDRFLVPWERRIGTPDKFDVWVTRIWN